MAAGVIEKSFRGTSVTAMGLAALVLTTLLSGIPGRFPNSCLMKEAKDTLFQGVTPLLMAVLALNHILSVTGNCPTSAVLYFSLDPSSRHACFPTSLRYPCHIPCQFFPSSFPAHLGILTSSTLTVNLQFSCSSVCHFHALYQSAVGTLQIIRSVSGSSSTSTRVFE